MHVDKIIKFVNKSVKPINLKQNPFTFPKKALIILPEFIGDTLLLTPVLRNMHYNFKDQVKLDLIGNSNAKNLLETLPYFDNFFIDSKENGQKVSFLKKQNYDTIFLFNFRFFWALAGYQTKIQQRIGFGLEKLNLENIFLWPLFFTHLIKSTTIYDDNHQINTYLNLLRSLQLNVIDDYPEIILTKNDINNANILIKDIKHPRVLIHATAGSPGKQWSLSNWAVIIKYLKDKYNCSIIATGNPSERQLYNTLSKETGIKIHNLCGLTTIRETIALYKNIDLAITLDTATTHLAAIADIKNIIVIYGPTNELQWRPYAPNSFVQQIYSNLDCRPCLTRICHHKNCLNNITPGQVISAIDKTFTGLFIS